MRDVLDLACSEVPLARAHVQTWLQIEVARQLGVRPEQIDAGKRFNQYGLDSPGAAAVVAAISVRFGRPFPPTLMWDYPTLESLAAHLAGQSQPSTSAPARIAQSAVHDGPDEPIAVVGMACRFPSASNPVEFWKLLSEGVDAIGEVPADRWDVNAVYDPDGAAPGKMSTRWGGFLDRIDRFDASFFSISPREAIAMDPQQRLMLELSWEALEDAGILPFSLRGTRTGVFFGVIWNDYATLTHRIGLEAIVQHSATGSHDSIVANRVSYVLGLEGPSLIVDTACSSSLVAIHLACQSLRDGEATICLVGGVNLIAAPESTVAMSKFGAMAPDGRSRAFDAHASGYVRGEGGGVVVLKPLSRALADGDPIYCVVLGSAVNNDGFSNGLTAPNPKAQEAVLRDAYARGGREPSMVHYVETHGTGTVLGDPIEAKALGQILSAGRTALRPLRIGSVKTNIGHLEAAAGIAGLMKVCLSIKHRLLPPSLHFKDPNPHIPFDELHMRVQTKLEPWPMELERPLGGVNSFGFGGTNCHVVVEGMPSAEALVLPLAAATQEQLHALVREARDVVDGFNSREQIERFCLAAGIQLSRKRCRIAFVASSRAELVAAIGNGSKVGFGAEGALVATRSPIVQPGAGERPPSPITELIRPRIVFVCPGQGSQWLGMGRNLLRLEPVFRAGIEACDRAIQAAAGWSLLDELVANESKSRLSHVDVVQPVLFSMQVALGQLWRSWGVEPDVLIGHSMGEIAAAHLSGILTLEDAARVICRRSESVRAMAAPGSMAVVALSAEDAARAIANSSGEIVVAGYNSPSSTLLSGKPDALENVLRRLEAEGIYAGRVKVNYASHSPHMDPLRAPFFEALAGLRPSRAHVRCISTVTLEDLSGPECGPHYWVRNLREPILFSQVVQKLLDEGPCSFIELSAHPTLNKILQEGISHSNKTGAVYPSICRGVAEHQTLFETLAALYMAGANVSWRHVYSRTTAVDLPSMLLPYESEAAAAPPERAEAPVLLPLSAHQSAALESRVEMLDDWIRAHPELHWSDICRTAAMQRTHFEYRLAITAHSPSEMLDALTALRRKASYPTVAVGSRAVTTAPKIVFVFPGHGSQWIGMGSELFETEPVFRHSLYAADRALGRYTGWSVIDELHASESTSRLNEADVIQPMVFATQVALAALWRSWGVEPAAVIGHSLGEAAAAVVAEALSLEDAACVIAQRSRIIRQHASGKGVCAMVELSFEEAAEAVKDFRDRLVVGVHNGPRSCVLSGAPEAMEQALERLRRRDVFCRLVKMDYASHSPQMDPLKPLLIAALSGIEPKPNRVPFYSPVISGWIAGERLDPAYWAKNLREPVQFANAVRRLREQDHDVFLEVSTHPVLVAPIEETLGDLRTGGEALASLRRNDNERKNLLRSLARLYVLGCTPEWTRLFPHGGHVVPLPPFPWQRERYWIEGEAARESARKPLHAQGDVATSVRAMFGPMVQPARHPDLFIWEMDLAANVSSYLDDHRIRDVVIFPAAAMVELVMNAAEEAFGPGPHVLESMEIKQAIELSNKAMEKGQLLITKRTEGRATFEIQTLETGSGQPGSSWKLHAEGRIHLRPHEAALVPQAIEILNIEPPHAESQPKVVHYQSMQQKGLAYGPRFQSVEHIWRVSGKAAARLRLHEGLADPTRSGFLHAAVLDGAFQVLLATLPGLDEGGFDEDVYLPVGIDRIVAYGPATQGSTFWCRASLRQELAGDGERFVGDIDLTDEEGKVLVETRGITVARVGMRSESDLEKWSYELIWEPKPLGQGRVRSEANAGAAEGTWLLFTDRTGVGSHLQQALESRGARCIVVQPGERFLGMSAGQYQINPIALEDMELLLRCASEQSGQAVRGIVHLWSLDALRLSDVSEASLLSALDTGCISVLYLVRALAGAGGEQAPRLWLITGGVQAVDKGPKALSLPQAPLWGLGRVIGQEKPDLRCTRIDLSPVHALEQVDALCELFCHAEEAETEAVLRGRDCWVSRLVRHQLAVESASRNPQVAEMSMSAVPGQDAFRLELSEPGVLDHLALSPAVRRAPGPGEIEIQVLAAGLNFRDVMKALGIYPGLPEGATVPIGDECVGRIVALGDGVEGFTIGTEVVAIAEHALGAFVIARAELVVPKPSSMTAEEAATIPVAFLTAYYALHEVGRIQKGERVLIHAAAGGVGLAAVQIARHAGAEVFATAGSPEKREYLRSLGVQHVSDSRSFQFMDDILSSTAGEGVDVVLNSLAGEWLTKSLSLLRPYGRFLEIGKRDLYQNSALQLDPFKKCLSFTTIDLDRIWKDRPSWVGNWLRHIMSSVEQGAFVPLVRRVFPISKAVEAFRFMAQGKHIGKIVLSFDEQTVPLAPPAGYRLKPQGTYLITGGLGGLGLKTASWMVERGAHDIVLVSRKSPGPQAEALIADLRGKGACIRTFRVDVAQPGEVAQMLEDVAGTMPPLRGIVHAAGIVDDSTLEHMNREQFLRVIAPKVLGAWNLHCLSRERPLDFFVCFSSVASLFGSAGQGNYAAANAFLDALAHHRRDIGLHGLSINWGPWRDVGMAAQENRGFGLTLKGFDRIRPEFGVKALDRLLLEPAPQVMMCPFRLRAWMAVHPLSAQTPLLASLRDAENAQQARPEAPSASTKLSRDVLLAVSTVERRSMLEDHLREQVGKILTLSPARLDLDQPFRKLGMDSLMTVEFRNRLEAHFGLRLSASMVWNYPNIRRLAGHIAEKLDVPLEASASTIEARGNVPAEADRVEIVAQLSETETEALLMEKLTKLRGMLAK